MIRFILNNDPSVRLGMSLGDGHDMSHGFRTTQTSDQDDYRRLRATSALSC